MRFRTLALALGLSISLTATSNAVVRPKGAEAPVVTSFRAPRPHRSTAWAKPAQLARAGLAGWNAIVDDDTRVPLRLWGPAPAVPGALAHAAVAEAAAREFLAAHLATLAPGASLADFTVVSNELGGSGDVRSIGFEQRSAGLRVLGGAIGFAFKGDRLTLVSSTALPNIAVAAPPSHPLAQATIADSAVRWLAKAGKSVALHGAALAPEHLIIPIVHPRLHGLDIDYRVVQQVSVQSTTDEGRWDVWIDANDGSPVARRSSISYASGVVSFDIPVQGPLAAGSPRLTVPAPFGTHLVDGVSTTATLDGVVTWAGTAAATVVPHLAGTRAAITNASGALVASPTLTLQPNGTAIWSAAADPTTDAQLDAYIFENTAKQFAKTRLNPNLAWLDQQVSVTVNENMTCNAYSTGDDVHFFLGDTMCENTGRLADVVYHETGHSVHYNSIIPGVGAFDPSLSEGLADTLAVSITRESGVGRGFFHNNSFLRDLDPVGVEKRWPQDADGEPHDEGEIIGETLIDLRKALIAQLGETAGFNQTLKIYYGIMQRAADIPSTYAEALLADDDDGDLSNGTPNLCLINTAFNTHGLADPSISLGLGTPTRDHFTVALDVTPATTTCPGAPTVSSVDVAWRVHGGTDAPLSLTASGTTFSGAIPTQPDGTTVEYQVVVTLSDTTTIKFPDNPADPYYQFYVGPVTPLYCADFESGAADWTHGGSPDQWQVGPPMGLGGDPKLAHGGTNVFGIDLSNTGTYADSATSKATSPTIDLKGITAVHLQYWRWLGVEDGAFDQATVAVNGTTVWSNLKTAAKPDGTGEVNHLDKEWRFQDIDVSAQAASGKLSVDFSLTSDAGLDFGGWTLDDVCIVALGANVNVGTCGNGVVDPGETCDDGNTTDGDGCSSTCMTEAPVTKDGGGCCSVGGSAGGPLALSLLTLGAMLRRRRR